MAWRAYQVILRLRSPLHIGWRKVGNLQMSRPYVTGRMMWGALTMRLTRNKETDRPAIDSRQYQKVGDQVNKTLAFTYFYPALKKEERNYKVCWPWENEAGFRRRFMSSYAGTALDYPQQAAAEGSLHEVEFLSPHTMDDGQPVFLVGYVFERQDCSLDWHAALERLQLGGERGYGWGRVEPVDGPREITDARIFDGAATFDGSGERPSFTVPEGSYLLAHTKADENLPIEGEIEPLVGREWRSDNPRRRHVGQHVEFTDICFVPGSTVHQAIDFAVKKFGVWERCVNRV